jgi:tetratricopeptide (TPR) repeat protein
MAFAVPNLGARATEVVEYLSRVERRAVGRTSRDRAAQLEAFVNLDLGRPQAAMAAFQKLSSSPDVGITLAALFWGGDSTAGARAAARLSSSASLDSLPDYVFETVSSELCVRTLWRQVHDEPVDVGNAIRTLRSTATDRDPAWPPTRNQVCADVLEAFAAQRAGAANAKELIDALDRTLVKRPERVLNWLNLAAARLLEAEGEYDRAAAAARRHIHYFGYVSFYATHLRESGRLADLAGDRDGAIEAYSRYLDLRQSPEPSVQPEVDAVREALGRLVGERGANQD